MATPSALAQILHGEYTPLGKGKVVTPANIQLETLTFSWVLHSLQSSSQFPPPPGSLSGHESPLEGSLLHSRGIRGSTPLCLSLVSIAPYFRYTR